MNIRTPKEITRGLTAVEVSIEDVEHALGIIRITEADDAQIDFARSTGMPRVSLSGPVVAEALNLQLKHLMRQQKELMAEYARVRDRAVAA